MKATMRQTTLFDIADRVGMSVNTVSRALRDKNDIGLKTKNRIRSIAHKLNYQPNQIARGLVLGRTNILGLVIETLDNPIYGHLATAIDAVAGQYGYSLQLRVIHSPDSIKEYAVSLTGKTVAGVIFAPMYTEMMAATHLLRDKGIPCAFSEYRFSSLEGDSVVVNRAAGARQAVNHLASLGRKRIIYLCSPPETIAENPYHRLAGYRDAMVRLGLEPVTVQGASTLENGYTKMREIIRRGRLPDGVFCNNDLSAFGAMQALYESGVSVPGDVAVVGYDDIPESAYAHPSLTTVAQPVDELSRLLVSNLIGRIENPELPFRHAVIEPSLIVRQST